MEVIPKVGCLPVSEQGGQCCISGGNPAVVGICFARSVKVIWTISSYVFESVFFSQQYAFVMGISRQVEVGSDAVGILQFWVHLVCLTGVSHRKRSLLMASRRKAFDMLNKLFPQTCLVLNCIFDLFLFVKGQQSCVDCIHPLQVTWRQQLGLFVILPGNIVVLL